MSSIKKLAGQTLWYGVPTITSRFLGYLMNMALPFIFSQPAKTADLTQVYAIIPFLNILFTYGVETAYFRFAQDENRQKLYSTLSISIFLTTIALTFFLFYLKPAITGTAGLEEHPEYINWMLWIIFFDTLATLPFARLRQENRPRMYALVRIAGIIMNILIVTVFMGLLPAYLQHHPDSFFKYLYNEKTGIGYYLIGNLCGSILTFLLLFKEFKEIDFSFDSKLWKKVIMYSYPLIIVGLGGMINDMLSRLVYQHVVDLPAEEAKHQLGVFANIYRLAILITIMIQAFRMAAEPFFFNLSGDENAQKTYARVMKFFVIACCFMYLLIGLYLDVLKWVITLRSPSWGEGIYVVLILALGNIFLGIYYNLSIWYKLTNKNLYGAVITIGGAVITIALNILLIPRFHYLGAAIATFCCYLFMMVTSYRFGQKYYPIPYAKKKLLAYLSLTVLVVLLHRSILFIFPNLIFSIISGTVLFISFFLLVIRIERKEFQKLPVVGKYLVHR
ncbi:MAG TPA: polysaccharide biosynthesis C-terminal domain-containing protein [Chitinophagaceae bacterium]|nr:polysaccharide biosynthesis C-terminal domain-containing protein [Chitinophagaceae bacterium]